MLAWNRLTGNSSVPEQIYEMKRRCGKSNSYKSHIYRLSNYLAGGSSVIAKQCRSEIAQHELVLYQKVGKLPLAIPEMLGCVEDQSTLKTYHQKVLTTWPDISYSRLRDIGKIGILYRWVAAADWICASLPYPDIRRPVSSLSALTAQIEEISELEMVLS